MFIVPMVLFIVARARGYYSAPAYAMLLAGGAVWLEQQLDAFSVARRKLALTATSAALVIGGSLAAAVALPIAPIGSRWFQVATSLNGDFVEELGWPELVQEVAKIRDSVPEPQRARLGILAANYGEAGAINLYGPAYGLPKAISGINSYWARGYGNPPPETLIVLGLSQRSRERFFTWCRLAGHTPNPYGIRNEETERHPDIYLCGPPRQPWPEFWNLFRYYG